MDARLSGFRTALLLPEDPQFMARNRLLPRLADYWGEALVSFPIGEQRIEGKTFQVYGFDADIHTFLHDLARYLRHTELRFGQLFPLREDFRKIRRRNSPIGLVYSLQSSDLIERRLAVWLLGHCDWPRGITFLRNCPPTTPVELQFEIARAMRRLRAWTDLRQLEFQVQKHEAQALCAGSNSSGRRFVQARWYERLKTMCQERASQDHALRLSRFLASCEASTSPSDFREPRPPSLWYQEPLGPGQAPKSRWFIRRILERIRMVVRG